MKRIYLCSVRLMQFALFFWFIYTAIFLVKDGWHYHAIDPIEIILDKIAAIMFKVAWVLWIIVAITLVNREIKK